LFKRLSQTLQILPFELPALRLIEEHFELTRNWTRFARARGRFLEHAVAELGQQSIVGPAAVAKAAPLQHSIKPRRGKRNTGRSACNAAGRSMDAASAGRWTAVRTCAEIGHRERGERAVFAAP
jgi:hypothetical protein